MKRFYSAVTVAESDGRWHVMLDARALKTQGKRNPQTVPSAAAAQLLAEEWRAQGEEIDSKSFIFRDLADYAIDVVRADRGGIITKLLEYAATDTLCYRADPGEPLYQHQQSLWEPLVTAFEARHDAAIQRVSGVIACPQPEATMAALRQRLESEDDFTLAALLTLAALAASLIVPLAVIDEEYEMPALFAAANAEEDWQAELWGWDEAAENARKARLEAFEKAAQFARAVRG